MMYLSGTVVSMVGTRGYLIGFSLAATLFESIHELTCSSFYVTIVVYNF